MNAKQLLYVTAGVFALLVLLIFKPIAKDNMSLFNSIAMLVLGYYFGSSEGSKRKTELLAPAPAPTTQEVTNVETTVPPPASADAADPGKPDA